MNELSGPFKIFIYINILKYPNKGFKKDGVAIYINSELYMDDFLRICSKMLSSS